MYEKTRIKYEKAKESENRDKINMVFDSFVRKYHKENISYLAQRAYSQFGDQVAPEMIEDCVSDIYFNMLLMDENDLMRMNEIDLLKIFRGICLGPVLIGAMHQHIKHREYINIDNLDYYI